VAGCLKLPVGSGPASRESAVVPAHSQRYQKPQTVPQPEAPMSEQPSGAGTVARRIQVKRRPARRAVQPDTTLTDTWPPRLNKEL